MFSRNSVLSSTYKIVDLLASNSTFSLTVLLVLTSSLLSSKLAALSARGKVLYNTGLSAFSSSE